MRREKRTAEMNSVKLILLCVCASHYLEFVSHCIAVCSSRKIDRDQTIIFYHEIPLRTYK